MIVLSVAESSSSGMERGGGGVGYRRGSVEGTCHFRYASSTLPLRCCYVPSTTMKIRLCLVYADSDVAATLLRPRRRSYAFFALVYPFYIKSEVQMINDRCAQVALLQLAIMDHRIIMLYIV